MNDPRSLLMARRQLGIPAALTVARVEVTRKVREDGSILLRNAQQLGPYTRCVGDWLEHWAEQTPDRAFLCERGADGEWTSVTYAQARERTWAIAESLLTRGLGPHRPVAALSPNSIAMGLMTLGAMHAGVPFAPVSTGYAALATDYTKLRHVFELLQPGLVFVSDESVFLEPLVKAGLDGLEVVSVSGTKGTSFGALCQAAPGERARRAFREIGPDTVGKILFTSGSTGTPKGVMNTHRMMCSNQQAISQLLPFHAESPPVMVDWMPWNHTAGGNGTFNRTLRHGGTLYIDEGKPVAGQFHKTIANLISVRTTAHTNVPKGYEMLLEEFERNPAFKEHFFTDLEIIAFAGAAMPRHHYERIRQMAHEVRGDRILFTSGFGATETAPGCTIVYFPNLNPANVGLPLPGTELKLLANGDKTELRVRGPNVMPGYWRQPEITRAAFDEEGFYCTGDAVRFLDPQRPEAGLLFDGRVSEDFKLSSATWVNTAAIRAKALAAGAPLFQDVVVTGHDRECIGLLVAINEPAARETFGFENDVPLGELAASAQVRGFVASVMARLASESTGSSTRPARAWVLDQAPSIANGEITEKGSLSQRTMLGTRKAEIEALYANPCDSRVILPAAC